MIRGRRVAACAASCLVLVGLPVRPARAQEAASSTPRAAASATASASATAGTGADGDTTFLVENVTRAEVWRYFQPPSGGGRRPDYEFAGTRFSLGAAYRGLRWASRGTLQYVRVENLPSGAIGPGLLGTGGMYFFQAAGAFSYQFYLRELSLTWQRAGGGAWVEAGRFSRGEHAVATGHAHVDALARESHDGRLLGDMPWSFYQRAWDGVRGGVSRGRLSAVVTAAMPTQGTYEESANLFLDRVPVSAVEAAIAPGRRLRHTRFDLFGYTYHDTRPVTARPDATAGLATRVDVHVRTAGASAVGAYPLSWGRVEATAWTAGQWGRWYEQRHRAMAATSSFGVRVTQLPWQPRIQAGVAYASGDGRASDGTHGTFFPMLPSGDRVSALNAYALMNVVDVWTSIEAQPSGALDLRAGVRRVALARGEDRWYQGTGATVRAGNYFGFQGRRSGGARDLGVVVEGAAAWRPRRWWTLRAYAGRMAGGDVVRGLFANERLLTAWLESTVHF